MISIQYAVRKTECSVVEIDKDVLKDIPTLIEGDKELDAIAPVNHVTGSRMNVLDLLGVVLSPDRKDLLQKFLADVPAAAAMTGLSDEDALSLLQERTCKGYPAEDDAYCKMLEDNASLLLPAVRQMASKSASDGQPKINFENTDTPPSE